jgi:hypothetical protein
MSVGLIYEQKTGRLLLDDALFGQGYSGFGPGKNNPEMQEEAGIGPLPCGVYAISEAVEESTTHGPFVLRLTPFKATNTFGRSGFLIHGDSKEHPGLASHGCIILPRSVREAIHARALRWVSVIP